MSLPDPWFTLAQALQNAATLSDYAAISDTIEKQGIWKLDTFERPVFQKGNSDDAKWAMGYVKQVSDYERDGPEHGQEDTAPPMSDLGGPDDLTWHFGWPESKPKFAETKGDGASRSPRTATAEKKLVTSRLVVIAALLKKQGLDWDEEHRRGAAAIVAKLVWDLGCHMDDETVTSIFNELQAAIDSRSRPEVKRKRPAKSS